MPIIVLALMFMVGGICYCVGQEDLRREYIQKCQETHNVYKCEFTAQPTKE